MQSDRVGRVPARGILLLAKSVEYTRPDVGSFSQRFGDGPKSIEGCPGNMVLHALDVTVNCFFVDVVCQWTPSCNLKQLGLPMLTEINDPSQQTV